MNWTARNKLNILRFSKKKNRRRHRSLISYTVPTDEHTVTTTRATRVDARITEAHRTYLPAVRSPWNSQGYSLLAFRWTRSKSRFSVFRKHCIQPLIAFVLISGFERRIVESRFCFHIVNARISQYSYLKSGVVHLKAPVQTYVLNYMVMSSIARSMLAELTYIVFLLVNWFLAWFTWKQAGITFRSHMLARFMLLLAMIPFVPNCCVWNCKHSMPHMPCLPVCNEII